jgi:hypothetical protein
MARSEEATRAAAEETEAAEKLRSHNHTLSVNLEAHARVVDKLVALNAELMDAANEAAFGRRHPAPPGEAVQVRLVLRWPLSNGGRLA